MKDPIDLATYGEGYPGYPYRFRGTEGAAAGTTFIYLSPRELVTYPTDNPVQYAHNVREGLGGPYSLDPPFYVLRPKMLEWFESIREWRPEPDVKAEQGAEGSES